MFTVGFLYEKGNHADYQGFPDLKGEITTVRNQDMDMEVEGSLDLCNIPS
jgi:hypothetical protein